MGIEGLNPFIKKKVPNAFFTLPLSQLEGKKIAIDVYDWMYANMAISRKKIIMKTDVTLNEPDPIAIQNDFLLAALNFTLKWINNDITPIFVFDGKNKPKEKDEVKLDRYEKQKSKRDRIDELYSQIKVDILANTNELVDELRKALCTYLPISKDTISNLKLLFDSLGVPWLQADGDAEPLCSSLCIEGKVAAVFSSDTDNLAYGCPLVIYGFTKGFNRDEFGRPVILLDCMRIDKVLEGLNITYQTFIDLCIMCGCDFNGNTHMAGYAAIKSYNLLFSHGLIDKIPKSDKYNTSCLKYRRCREIFRYVPSDNIIVKEEGKEISLDINKTSFTQSSKFFNSVDLGDELDKICGTIQKFKGSTPGLIENLELKLVDFNYVYDPPKRLKLVIVNNNK